MKPDEILSHVRKLTEEHANMQTGFARATCALACNASSGSE